VFQVFFSTADETRQLGVSCAKPRDRVDETMIEAYGGTTSLPFAAGPHKRVAVKIIDDRAVSRA
jgi:adenine-specific DNA-methyltransferase